MEYKITLPCSNGFTLHASDGNIIVETKKEEETIPISNIQSFSLKEPGLSFGKIVFATAKAASAGIGLGLGVGAAVGAEKTFFFKKADLDTAKMLRDYVTGYDSHATQPAQAPEGMVVSVVDEIRGLKSLLDDGILTQEEFDLKKKQLLGL